MWHEFELQNTAQCLCDSVPRGSHPSHQYSKPILLSAFEFDLSVVGGACNSLTTLAILVKSGKGYQLQVKHIHFSIRSKLRLHVALKVAKCIT